MTQVKTNLAKALQLVTKSEVEPDSLSSAYCYFYHNVNPKSHCLFWEDQFADAKRGTSLSQSKETPPKHDNCVTSGAVPGAGPEQGLTWPVFLTRHQSSVLIGHWQHGSSPTPEHMCQQGEVIFWSEDLNERLGDPFFCQTLNNKIYQQAIGHCKTQKLPLDFILFLGK